MDQDTQRTLVGALKFAISASRGDDVDAAFWDKAGKICSDIIRQLQPKQALAMFNPASEVLYGGAFGGGKSFFGRALIMIAVLICRRLQAIFFRHDDAELDSQVFGSGGFEELMSPVVDAGMGEIVGNRLIRLTNHSRVDLRHFQHWKYHSKYKAEPHLIVFDEAGDFEFRKISWMRARLRLADYQVSLRDQLREVGQAPLEIEDSCGAVLSWWLVASMEHRSAELKSAIEAGDSEGIRRASSLVSHINAFEWPKWATKPRRTVTDEELPGLLLAYFEKILPRLVLAGNPRGACHEELKRGFVDPGPPGSLFKAPEKEGAMTRLFVRALVADNPLHDDDYSARLTGLGDDETIRALRDGDWDVSGGSFFGKVWRSHPGEDQPAAVIAPFSTPKQWPTFRGHDWGSSDPYYTGWWAIADGTEVQDGNGNPFCPPRGSIIWIAEDYGCVEGKHEGLNLDPAEVARRGLQAEYDLGIHGHVKPGPADGVFKVVTNRRQQDLAQIFAQVRAPQREDARLGWSFVRPIKDPGTREQGWTLIHAMLGRHFASPEDQSWSMPRLYIFASCRSLIRLLGGVQRHDRKHGDIADNVEDHPLDVLRYAVLASFSPAAPGVGGKRKGRGRVAEALRRRGYSPV